jgi:hypothetical protein
MNKYFSIGIRAVIGIFAATIGAGAFLGAYYLTGIGGLSLAWFATINPPYFKEKTNASYWLAFSAWIILFLILSYMDMDSGVTSSAPG